MSGEFYTELLFQELLPGRTERAVVLTSLTEILNRVADVLRSLEPFF
jgi:hypothetical protein